MAQGQKGRDIILGHLEKAETGAGTGSELSVYGGEDEGCVNRSRREMLENEHVWSP